MFKVYYKNTWTTSVAYRSSVFIFNFEHISYLFLVFQQMLAWLLFFPIDESKETRNQSGICIWCKTCKKVVSDFLTYLVLICCVELFLLWLVAIRNIFFSVLRSLRDRSVSSCIFHFRFILQKHSSLAKS